MKLNPTKITRYTALESRVTINLLPSLKLKKTLELINYEAWLPWQQAI